MSAQAKARNIVAKYVRDHAQTEEEKEIDISEVDLVWFSKTLKNWKALVTIWQGSAGLYFEVTHNGEKNEEYVDVYAKQDNVVVKH